MSDPAPGKVKCSLCFINGNNSISTVDVIMSSAIVMRQKYSSCTNPHHILSQVCMLPHPVHVLVSAPPVIWHSVQRMLVRITCVSGNADGTRGQSINHHPKPLSPTSPSCTASVQMCRNDPVPLFYGGH